MMMDARPLVHAVLGLAIVAVAGAASAQANLSIEAAATAAAAAPAAGPTTAAPETERAPAAAPTTEASPSEADEEANKPFSVGASLDTTLGQGTFVANEYARNPLFSWSLGLTPSYSLNDDLSVSAGFDFSQELTSSDDDTRPQQFYWSDISLGASYSLWAIPTADINVKAGLKLAVPTSLASQASRLYTSVSPSLGFTREFGPVSVGWTTSFKKNFHQYTSPVLDTEGLDASIFLARVGGNENLGEGLLALGGNNTSFSFKNAFTVGYDLLDKLSVGASFSLSNSFTYEGYAVDEMSSPYAVAGRGQRDSVSGSLSADYTIDDRFALSAGVSTASSPMTSDMTGFRFPFWDLESTAENLTTFGLSLSVSESFAIGE